MIPIVIGAECQRETYITDVPCIVITSWEYSTDCINNSVTIYNSTGESLTVKSLGDYGNTSLCNFTFNYSSTGTYPYNITSNDSGVINVINVTGEAGMASLGVILFVTILTAGLFYLPKKITGWTDKEYLNTALKGCCYVLGLFLLSLDTTIVVTIADTFNLGVNKELFRYLWIINWGAVLTMGTVTLLFGWKVLKLWDLERYNKTMGYDVKNQTGESR